MKILKSVLLIGAMALVVACGSEDKKSNSGQSSNGDSNGGNSKTIATLFDYSGMDQEAFEMTGQPIKTCTETTLEGASEIVDAWNQSTNIETPGVKITTVDACPEGGEEQMESVTENGGLKITVKTWHYDS